MNIESLEKLLGGPRDSAMLRLTLARLLSAEHRETEAEAQLAAAVAMNAAYTAAWKELGKVRQRMGDQEGARAAWLSGVETAHANGDKQAEREMGVFLKRLEKQPRQKAKER